MKRRDSVPLRYKVVETSDVTDVEIEKILNEWTEKGWTLDTMQFAMRDSSKRPAMAFITFTRAAQEAEEQA
jgi:hypothetical protein